MESRRGRIYNRIFNPSDWEQVNNENKRIIEDFLEEYKQRKMKKGTLKQYYNDLRIVLIYIKNYLDNRNLLELTKKDFRRLSIWLTEDLHLSNARVNRILSAVRSLLNYVEDDDDYDYENNVARKIKGLPKEPVKTSEENFFLTFEQIMKLRNELIRRGQLQNAVLLMLMFDSGARRNEVYQVKKYGLTEGNKTNLVVGKRGKVFPLIYMNDTRELIAEYLKQRGEDDIDSLWITGSGENKRPASYESLYDRIVSMSKVLSEIEGREIKFFPHSLRHSRAECLMQGQDPRIIDPVTGQPRKFSLQEVQIFLHHSDPKTTQGYLKDHTEELIDQMFNLF